MQTYAKDDISDFSRYGAIEKQWNLLLDLKKIKVKIIDESDKIDYADLHMHTNNQSDTTIGTCPVRYLSTRYLPTRYQMSNSVPDPLGTKRTRY